MSEMLKLKLGRWFTSVGLLH